MKNEIQMSVSSRRTDEVVIRELIDNWTKAVRAKDFYGAIALATMLVPLATSHSPSKSQPA
jgi:ketosteroid isomerase-like protein